MQRETFSFGSLIVESDFPARYIRDDLEDKDIFVDLGGKTINIFFENLPSYLPSRIQLMSIRGVLFRCNFNKTISTIHFLQNIDLFSSSMNFEFDSNQHYILLENDEFSASFYVYSKLRPIEIRNDTVV